MDNVAALPLMRSSCSSAGCLVTYLEDFLEAGEDAANLLDRGEKQAILAAARRKVSPRPHICFWTVNPTKVFVNESRTWLQPPFLPHVVYLPFPDHSADLRLCKPSPPLLYLTPDCWGAQTVGPGSGRWEEFSLQSRSTDFVSCKSTLSGVVSPQASLP